jgi:hypothetical protein
MVSPWNDFTKGQRMTNTPRPVRKSKQKQVAPAAITPSPITEARGIPALVHDRLIATSAGRCEFRGCNRDIFQHPVTCEPGNFSQQAHIVAFRKEGPRGDQPRPEDINAFENLMLLCGDCHHLIDTHHGDYTVELLKEHKREHEDRIFAVTAMGPEYRSTVIQLRGKIGGQPVDIPGSNIMAALQPRYPARLPGVLIDLTGFDFESPEFFKLARAQIKRVLEPALQAELEAKHVQHYSVFALAPIPTLMCLGRALGNKVQADLFQLQRDKSWRWKDSGDEAKYELRKLSDGTDPRRVALRIAISGTITPASIPADIDASYTVYEIGVVGQAPSVEVVKTRWDLDAFRKTYRDSIAKIAGEHDGLDVIHVFPAVPAPVAVACGQEVMPKAHPALAVYDNVKGTFKFAITLNTEEDL